MNDRHRWKVWFARSVVGTVFVVNVWCALVFIFDTDTYVAGFELSGVAGRVMVQGIGILFLMWNATYPLVLRDPEKYRAVCGVVLVQQAIGVIGETWLTLTLPPGHSILVATGARFIVFDFAGLLAMLFAFVIGKEKS